MSLQWAREDSRVLVGFTRYHEEHNFISRGNYGELYTLMISKNLEARGKGTKLICLQKEGEKGVKRCENAAAESQRVPKRAKEPKSQKPIGTEESQTEQMVFFVIPSQQPGRERENGAKGTKKRAKRNKEKSQKEHKKEPTGTRKAQKKKKKPTKPKGTKLFHRPLAAARKTMKKKRKHSPKKGAPQVKGPRFFCTEHTPFRTLGCTT
jgi:hypothetical protein